MASYRYNRSRADIAADIRRHHHVYTGNPFTTVRGPYTTSDFVRAMVTLSSLIPANQPLTLVTPIAFSLSDGVQTITDHTPGLSFLQFAFATRPHMHDCIMGCGHFNQLPEQPIFTQNTMVIADDGGISPGGGVGDVRDNPGTWTTASVPDTGPSLALWSLSLTALNAAERQFKRAAD